MGEIMTNEYWYNIVGELYYWYPKLSQLRGELLGILNNLMGCYDQLILVIDP